VSADGGRVLEVRALGRTAYADAHRLQQALVEQRLAGAVPDLLLLTEHDPVVTVGRGAGREAAAGVSAPVFEVERGGEATYHGPGQVVAYPIALLEPGRRDLHRWLRDLEEAVIRTVGDFGVTGRRDPGLTGVWIGARKVCSIGVAVRRWVTWHGLALNVCADLGGFRSFQPCGLDPDVMTNLAQHASRPAPPAEVADRLALRLAEVLGYAEVRRPTPPAPRSSG
jgi:lipoate-protein ligase B